MALLQAGYISVREVVRIKSQLTDIKKAEELTNSFNRIIINISIKEKRCYEAIRLLEKHNSRMAFVRAQMLYRLASCYYILGDVYQSNKLLYDLDALAVNNVTPFVDIIKQEKKGDMNSGYRLRKNSQWNLLKSMSRLIFGKLLYV